MRPRSIDSAWNIVQLRGLIVVLMCASVVSMSEAASAHAICIGRCSASSRRANITGLVHPPTWADGRRIHFEPSAREASSLGLNSSRFVPGTLLPAGEGGRGQGPLLYHPAGSGVEHTPKVYVIFWGSNFTSKSSPAGLDVRSMILKLFEGLSSSSYQGILTQYFDATGRVSSSVAVKSLVDKSVAAPSLIGALAVEEEIANVIAAKKWHVEQTAQFLVLTAPGSTYQEAFMAGCAFHSVTTGGAVYDFVPYQGDQPFSSNGCIETGNPNKNPVDKTSKSASHEYAEAATDPLVDAWYTINEGAFEEVADLCSSQNDFELPSGAWAQSQYDNHLLECSREDLAPPNEYVVTEAASDVKNTGAQLNGTVNPESYPTKYHFEWGVGAPVGHVTPDVNVVPNTEDQVASGALSTLAPSKTFSYRLIATNVTGTVYGGTHTLTTPPVAEFGASGTEAGKLEGPTDITRDVGGDLWIAEGCLCGNLPQTRAQEFNSRHEYVRTFDSRAGGAAIGTFDLGIGIDTHSNVWIAETSRVSEFNQTGELVRQFGTKGTGLGQFTEASDVAVDAQGHVWVVDSGGNRLEEFSEHGEYLKTVGSAGTGGGQLTAPAQIAISGEGQLWVTDRANHRVDEFGPGGEYVASYGSEGTGPGQFEQPHGIGVDPSGDIWVSDIQTNEVQELSGNGAFMKLIGTGGSGNGQFEKPEGVFAAEGYTWIADRENRRVEEWTIG